MFPPEIWEMILRNVDPTDLERLQLVCKDWCAIIKRIFKSALWYDTDIQHAPMAWVLSTMKKITGDMTIQERRKKFADESVRQEYCHRIYQIWRRWRISMHIPKSVKIVNGQVQLSKSEHITCLDTRSDVIGVGTSAGKMYFSHFSNWKKPFFIADYDKAVAEIQFWNVNDFAGIPESNKEIVTVVRYADNTVKYWEFMKRRELPSRRDCGKFLSLRVLLNLECGFFIISDKKIKRSKYIPDVLKRVWTFPLRLDATREIIRMHSLEHKALQTCDEEKTKNHELQNVSFDRPAPLHDYEHEPLTLPKELVLSKKKKLGLFYQNVTFCLSDNFLAFSVNSQPWVLYNIFNQLGAKVRYMKSNKSGSAFMLGLDTGEVHLFQIPENDGNAASRYRELENFNFATSASCKVKLNNKPIISVTTFSTGFHYCVIAATERAICIDKKEVVF